MRMRNAVVTAIVGLALGAAHATAGAVGSPVSTLAVAPSDAANTANALAGEWEGQLEIRSDGALSTSPASMSARLRDGEDALEIYYEGFAFGKPVEGAMVLSFDGERGRLRVRDGGTGLRARCTERSSGEQASQQGLTFGGSSDRDGAEVRTRFVRDDSGSWSIQHQKRAPDGEWASLVSLHVGRLADGQRSAAAAGFDSAAILRSLRAESASASVDTDR